MEIINITTLYYIILPQQKKKYPIHSTQPRKRFVLNLHYNGNNSFLFVNATKIYKFKAKDSEIKNYALCLGNISENFTINNMKQIGIKRIVNFFC